MAACIYVDGRANLIVNLAPDFLCSISIIPNPINSRILINIYSLITLARFFFFFFFSSTALHDLLLIWTPQLIWSKIKKERSSYYYLLALEFLSTSFLFFLCMYLFIFHANFRNSFTIFGMRQYTQPSCIYFKCFWISTSSKFELKNSSRSIVGLLFCQNLKLTDEDEDEDDHVLNLIHTAMSLAVTDR